MTKIYKFRPLASERDFNRIQNILKTSHFWCSRFWDLNDPMEGIFLANSGLEMDTLFSDKNKYMICSFSGVNGFKNPTLWGYYANGFKGIAIEINIKNDLIKKIDYTETLNSTNDLLEILSRKGRK